MDIIKNPLNLTIDVDNISEDDIDEPIDKPVTNVKLNKKRKKSKIPITPFAMLGVVTLIVLI